MSQKDQGRARAVVVPWKLICGTKKQCEAKRREVKAEAALLGVDYECHFKTKGINDVFVYTFRWRLHPSPRPQCGAKCRSGRPCQAKVAYLPNGDWATRCKRHGGLSTGPRTPEGRQSIGAANSRRKGTAYKKRTLSAAPAAKVPAHQEKQEKPAAPPTLAESAARELERREKLGIL